MSASQIAIAIHCLNPSPHPLLAFHPFTIDPPSSLRVSIMPISLHRCQSHPFNTLSLHPVFAFHLHYNSLFKNIHAGSLVFHLVILLNIPVLQHWSSQNVKLYMWKKLLSNKISNCSDLFTHKHITNTFLG